MPIARDGDRFDGVGGSAASGAYDWTSGDRFVTFRAAAVATPRAIGIRDLNSLAAYARAQGARIASCVNALTAAYPERAAFEWCYVVDPGQRKSSEGTVEAICRARLTNALANEGSEFDDAVTQIVRSTYVESDLDPIEKSFSTIDVRALQMICRRVRFDALEGAASPVSRVSGFAGTGVDPSRRHHSDTIATIGTFQLDSRLADAISVLLRGKAPTILCVRLEPTRLLTAEREFLDSQYELSERHAQLLLKDPKSDISFRSKAQLLSHQLLHRTRCFDEGALRLTILLGSGRPIPRVISNLIGACLSAPEPGSLGAAEAALAVPGCDVIDMDPALGPCITEMRPAPGIAELAGTSVLPGRLRELVAPFEAAAVFAGIPLSDTFFGIAQRRWRRPVPPARLPDRGVVIGQAADPRDGRIIRIGDKDRALHTFVSGATGSGKSTLLASMAEEDVRRGHGICVIDPHHGDLAGRILRRIPTERVNDVIVLDPSDSDAQLSLNLFEFSSPDERHFVVNELVALALRLTRDQFSDGRNLLGPVLVQHLTMNALLATTNPENPPTLIEFLEIFSDTRRAVEKWMPLKDDDPVLNDWVFNTLPKLDYRKTGDGTSMGSYVTSKLQPLVTTPRLRALFGRRRSSFDMLDVLTSSKILLVNLAKGTIGELPSRTLGMVVLAKLYTAAMRRAAAGQSSAPFHVYCDEYESVASESAALMLAEARKWNVSLTMAIQHWAQLDPKIQAAVAGNAGNLIAFRNPGDADHIAPLLGGGIAAEDLRELPNFHAYVRALVDLTPQPAFVIRTRLPIPETALADAQQVKIASAERYATKLSDALAEVTNDHKRKTRFELLQETVLAFAQALRDHEGNAVAEHFGPDAMAAGPLRMVMPDDLTALADKFSGRVALLIDGKPESIRVSGDVGYCQFRWGVRRPRGEDRWVATAYRDLQVWRYWPDRGWKLSQQVSRRITE